MKRCSSTVAIVVDPEFGDRLDSVVNRQCAWIAESAANRVAVERLRRGKLAYVVTIFFFDPTASRAEVLARILPAVDEHHGTLSCNPPYKRVSVYGVQPTAIVQAALTGINFESDAVMTDGFIARHVTAPRGQRYRWRAKET